MIFELSRNYEKAWELIQQGDRLACWVDYDDFSDKRVVASAFYEERYDATQITDNEFNYLYLLDQNTFEVFVERCTKLNIEFYLPLPNNIRLVDIELLEKVAREVIKKSVEDPLDALVKKLGAIA